MNKARFIWAILLVVLVGVIGGLFVLNMNQPALKSEPSKTPTSVIGFRESPDLKKLVSSGMLPPVAQRLPKVPLIVQPEEKVGVYGGVWHEAMQSKNDHASFVRTLGYENLVRWNKAWTGIVPNVALSYESTPDGKEYVFHLREGMKWSDGQPFTADDVMFWYEDIFSNPDLSALRPAWLVTDGKPVVVEKINSTTVRFTFASPNGLFLSSLAQAQGAEPTSYPKHYLSQFLPKYNPDLAALMKNEGVKSVVELLAKKIGTIGSIDNMDRWQHPELPVLNAWVLTNRYGDVPTVIAKRNPYYWKSDTAGNQLPYIDEIDYLVTDSATEMVDLAVAGKIDMQDRNIGNSALGVMASRSRLEANQEKGGYHFFQTVPANMNSMAISLNLNHKDSVLRKIFQDKNFRIAISRAINRQAIVDDSFGGIGRPYQLAPRPESPFYDEEMARQYTDYAPTDANTLLDDLGLKARDDEGWRLRPDGKRLSFSVDKLGDVKPLQMMAADLKKVGIELKIGITSDRQALYARKNANDHDMVVWSGDGGLDVIQDPRYYFPYSNESNYALNWAKWFYAPGDPDAEEPPAAVKQQQDLFRQIIATPDAQRQVSLMKDILKISKEQFYAIGVSLTEQTYGVVKNDFHNVPGVMPTGWVYPNPAPTNPCQYFIQP